MRFQAEVKIFTLAIMLTSCSPSDIFVQNDYGESVLVKRSGLRIKSININELAKESDEILALKTNAYEFGRSECIGTPFNVTYCDILWNSSKLDLEKLKKRSRVLNKLKAYGNKLIFEIEYRSLVADVNGNKAASDWTTINCIARSAGKEINDMVSSLNIWVFPREDGTMGSRVESNICKSL